MEQLGTEFADLEHRWKNEWRQAAIAPRSPGEMQNWLQSFATLRTQAEEIGKSRLAIDDRLKYHLRLLGV